MQSYDGRSSRQGADTLMYEGPKFYARKFPHFKSTLIHISEAKKRGLYFHPFSFEPMHARLKSETPHFYYKAARTAANSALQDDDANREGFENEGLAHILAIQAIMGLKGLKMQLGSGPKAEVHHLVFDEVDCTRKAIHTPSGKLIYPDLVATIRSPEIIKEQFKGKLYIEVGSHNLLDDTRVAAYRSMEHGAIELKIEEFRDIFEQRERELILARRPITSKDLEAWTGEMKRRINGKLWPMFTHDPCAKLRPRKEDDAGELLDSDPKLPSVERDTVARPISDVVPTASPPLPALPTQDSSAPQAADPVGSVSINRVAEDGLKQGPVYQAPPPFTPTPPKQSALRRLLLGLKSLLDLD